MKNSILIVILALTTLMMGCTNNAKKAPEYSGFLEYYDLLEQVPSPEGTYFFTYENPNINQHEYYAAIIKPVAVYRDPRNENEMTHDNIERARRGIDAGLNRVIGDKYILTQTSGRGVMELNVAITGAYLEGEGFKIWNIIPVSAAITLASKATGLDNKKAVLVVELKFTDSSTGDLIKETVTVISSDDFRQESNINAEFEQLAESWAQQALPVL